MRRILLIGAGQLGSRYLQGLTKADLRMNVCVVDPIDQSLEVAKQRWLEAGGNKSGHQVEWHRDLGAQDNLVDLAIISTPSSGRAALVAEVASIAKPHYWVLEKVLAKSSRELDFIKASTAEAKGIWVNTARRLMTWQQQIKTQLAGQGPLCVTRSGGLWGLACNSIHFIDLVAWWTGESLVTVDSTSLDSQWFESKRPGYFEVAGELVARFSGGTVLVLHSQPDAAEEVIHVDLQNGAKWVINEGKGVACGPGDAVISGRVEYQSEMTAPLVTEILTNGTCSLPTLQVSSAQHAIFLDAMLTHWNRSQNRNAQEVPIT